MPDYVLDASAILALLQNEPGADYVHSPINDSRMVNESLYRNSRRGGDFRQRDTVSSARRIGFRRWSHHVV